MATVVKINSGKIMYGTTSNEVTLLEDEILINKNPTVVFLDGYYNFETDEFYESATQEEIDQANKPIVPEIITRRQFKIALAVLGKNENDILNGINQLPEPTRTIALISYTEAGTFERNNPELIFVGKTFLQMTDDEIDNVFLIGSQY